MSEASMSFQALQRSVVSARRRFVQERTLVVLGYACTFLSASVGLVIQWLMEATRVPGGLIILAFHAPLFWLAIRVRSRIQGPVRHFAVLFCCLAVSISWSENALDGANKCITLAITLAWAICVSESAVFSTAVIRAAFVVCAFVPCLLVGGFELKEIYWHYPFAIIAIFGGLYLDERFALRRPKRVFSRVISLVGLVGLVVASTFRAGIIGTAAGLIATAVRNIGARAVVMILLIAGIVAVTASPDRGRQDIEQIERTDLVGRMYSIGNDRLSYRQDIWLAILDEALARPGLLVYGIGLGDVDYYLGALEPDHIAVYLSRDGRPLLHSHNLWLEAGMAAGLIGIACVILLFWGCVVRLKFGSAVGGLTVAVLVMTMAGVPPYDWQGGGALCFGLALGLLSGGAHATGKVSPTIAQAPIDGRAGSTDGDAHERADCIAVTLEMKRRST